MTKTITSWIKDQQFESEHEGNRIKIDGDKKKGHGPKALLLSALAGCSGIDVVEILTKMKLKFSDFSIEVEAEQTDTHPKIFKSVHAKYKIRIDEEQKDKVIRAIELSLDKYCGVSAMLKKNSPIDYTLEILK